MLCSLLLLLSVSNLPAAAEPLQTLEALERQDLRRYLAELRAGRPGSAATVERLAGLSFAGLREIIDAYLALPEPIEMHTHRAFYALLERTSRAALSPWPMILLYSPDFAAFLTRPLGEHPQAQRLFQRLLASDSGRQAFDLIVRLTPEASLSHLASAKKEKRQELLEAWNRRLAQGRERRPIPQLGRYLEALAGLFSLDLPPEELEHHLRFLAAWPELRSSYREALRRCLSQERSGIVLAGLVVQQRVPLLVELNEALITRFAEQPKLVEQALRSFAFDDRHDHSANLRRLWSRLPAEQVKARYQCLFAMGVHAAGNDALAFQAIQEDTYDLLDVAFLVLKKGDRDHAEKAIRHVLTSGKRGHEEALRLARERELSGFEPQALAIARDAQRDQVLRQTALLYLGRADGKTRRQLLPFLTHPNGDIRLAAIRTFSGSQGLSAADQNDIGPALIRVALDDPSMGHRQEAIYVLGTWKAPLAADFFRKVLADNPPVPILEGHYNDGRYWQYRFRLMALLGQARLGEPPARRELLDMHDKGGPTERMDSLLAFLDLGEAPECAFADLTAAEPRLVATAAQVIASNGDAAARARLRDAFRGSPLWREFLDSGIDDYNILRIVGLSKDEEAER